MKKKETIRSLWTPTAGMLSGARRAAMLLLTTLLLTMTAQTARANYDWYDTSITIGGITADFSQWSLGNGAPDTDLGFLNSLTISSIELKIWDDSNDRGGINMFFRLYGDNGQIGGDVDVWLGGAERIEGDHDFSISYTGPFGLADAFGVTLEHGKTYYLTMYAKTYGDSGDHWYNGDGDNYHTKFTYISNDDVWDLSTKTLTVKSNPADETYKNRSIIENLIISDGVTSIGDYAFAGCSGLTEITISSSVTSIGQYAFGSTQSDSYQGDHVYVEMPGNKRLSVTIAGVTDPVVIVPTNNNADILDCLFADPTDRSVSRALTLSQFAIWYVNANAASGGDGKSEETTFQTLKEVLDYANDGDVIMIASGTYTGDQNIGLTINKSLSFEKYLPSEYTQDEVVFEAQDQGNIWTVETGIDIDISDFTFKNGTITNKGTLTISKSLTLDNSSIINSGTVQIADGQVLKYTDDGGQVHLLCGTLDADAINALANKDITFFGYGGHCGQDNPETTDVDESKNVMWCISPDDPATADIDESKVLTISGTGYMMYYNSIQNADESWSNGAPWKAFADEIEAVVIEDGITYVGSNTFAHCPYISSVTLPAEGIYQIGPGAFADCTSLTSIDIPMSVNNIGDGAFAGCRNLATVSIGYGEASSFTIGTDVFPATAVIIVPEASLSGYQTATGWSTYQIVPATRTLFAAESTKLWMTWCDKYAYVKPEGAAVYTVSSVATDKVTLAEVSGDVIPAYTPVLLYRAAAGEDAVTATFSAVGTAPASGYDAANGICSQSNQAGTFTFFGATTAMAKIPDNDFTYYNGGLTYVLYGDKFLKSDSNNGIAANRCWLKLPTQGATGGANARQLVIVVDDDATAIADRQLSTVNSQLNEWYTLDGRKLSGKPTKKGLYIYNGKKTVVK